MQGLNESLINELMRDRIVEGDKLREQIEMSSMDENFVRFFQMSTKIHLKTLGQGFWDMMVGIVVV